MGNRVFLLAAASMALCANAAHAAQAAEAACLTEAEVEGVLVLVMPDVVRELAKICRPTLPGTAYLAAKGEALAAKFETEAETTSAAALSGITKMVGADGKDLPPDAMAKVIKAVVGPELSKEIKVKDCPAIDRVLGYLDPLPARNTSGLVTLILKLSSTDSGKDTSGRKKDSGFPNICNATPA
jgi:hypothetical protein